jgi:archaellum component FlaF (FlaF/FlaG flagellin family)
MFSLLRSILIIFIVWLICYSIYYLGQKNAFKNRKKKHNDSDHRKKVDSTEVEKEKNK